MTTRKQDEDFIADLINPSLLDAAIEWIGNNLAPETVFKDTDLDIWATDNGYIKKEEL